MLCSNCGKNEASVRYTRIINGEKTEFALCEECAMKEGFDDIDFNMPINFSDFLSDFFEDDQVLPSFIEKQEEKCPKCGMTYEDFANNGKLGCAECYNTFSNRLDSILKNLHGTEKHIGRKPKNILNKNPEIKNIDNINIDNKNEELKDEKNKKINDLNKILKQAIKEERYEDAAKIRDEIKTLEGK